VARLVSFDGLLDLRGAIAGMVENVRTMSGDTSRIESHAKHLDSIDERLGQTVELMERMVSSVEDLSVRVKELEDSLEPVGRLANRFPGNSRR
jgi:methyl-accepting chemotaxis protein